MENLSEIKLNFDSFIKSFKTSENDMQFRKKSFDHFIKSGYPSIKNEEWKYSPLVKDLLKFDKFKFSKSDQKEIPKKYISNFDHYEIIFIDGELVSKNINLEGLKISKNEFFLKSVKKEATNPILNLNNAFADQGYLIELNENINIEKPVVIYQFYSESFRSSFVSYKNFILLKENSSLIIYEKLLYESSLNFLVTSNTEIFLAKNSTLKKYDNNLDNKNSTIFNFVKSNLDENSFYETFAYSENINSKRDETIVNLNGQRSYASVNNLQLLKKNNNHEIKLLMNHNEENTKSSQFIKSALYDTSTGVFQGKIFVDSKAQKTDGYQLSRALMLSENSKFLSKPELEIYADDVKCSHGSSSGSIDQESIFYLRSRGINHDDAKELMIKGFLAEIIDKITNRDFKNIFYNQLGYRQSVV